MILLKSEREVRYMREAGMVVALALEAVGKVVEPGITTQELDRVAEKTIREQGAKPAFKGLYGFPASICVSINCEVVHGIPGSRKLAEGDIVSVDCGATLGGFNGDSAVTFTVGTVADETQKLVDETQNALYKGIAEAVAGNKLGAISEAIQKHAEQAGFSIVREYVGHGIGRSVHEEPEVPNYGFAKRGPLLTEGMVLAIEPMVNLGLRSVKVAQDGWTVVTRDGKPSAHFEHTVAITSNGPEILTRLA
ncbi:MAG TPA: type I methionyl aminopeptidase [Candidatus Avacidaminococcus intestinavium]|uniref:Methionine aminopeptidase n=1 Tax=Candidatus Avacidaminococcus intestinavium TaxID=2840684 RepID=A0A9D1SKA8_9FIRM|nr:type I methionyl aminopeptidase [Candidatus Avacidaminococcus intestinavium]